MSARGDRRLLAPMPVRRPVDRIQPVPAIQGRNSWSGDLALAARPLLDRPPMDVQLPSGLHLADTEPLEVLTKFFGGHGTRRYPPHEKAANGHDGPTIRPLVAHIQGIDLPNYA